MSITSKEETNLTLFQELMTSEEELGGGGGEGLRWEGVVVGM